MISTAPPMSKLQSIKKYLLKVPFLSSGIALLFLGGFFALGLRPSYDSAQLLERAQVTCGNRVDFPYDRWRGFFWSPRKIGRSNIVARGHYNFTEERHTVLRITTRHHDHCTITFPNDGNIPETLDLGWGFPARRKAFKRSAPHDLKISIGETEKITLFERSFERVESGWQRERIDVPENQSGPLNIEIRIHGRRGDRDLFLNLSSPPRFASLGTWILDNPSCGRITWWILNWCLCLGLIFILWQILLKWGLFESSGFSQRTLVYLFLSSLVVMTFFSWYRSLQPSAGIHFVQQADAVLHATNSIATHHDLGSDYIWHEGRQYAPFLPGISYFMVPLVFLAGMKFNDVILTIILNALNVVVIASIFGKLSQTSLTTLKHRENIIAACVFGLLSPLMTLSLLGCVWQTAQVSSVTMTLIALCFSISSRRPLFAGVALGLAILIRPPVVGHGLLCLSLILYFVWKEEEKFRLWPMVKKTILFALGPIVSVLSIMGLNYVRFGSIWDTGYSTMTSNMRRYGQFNTRFLGTNAKILFTDFPTFSSQFPYVHFTARGNSIFSVFPPIVLSFLPNRFHPLWVVSIVTAALCIVPALLYAETGWKQFGFRRVTDALPALIFCFALGQKKLGVYFWILAIIAVFLNLIAVWWLHGPDWTQPADVFNTF